MDVIILDVGGAGLVVEVNTDNFSWRPNRTGTSIEPAYSGAPMVTRTYRDTGVWTFTTKWLTTNEYKAIEGAAKFPEVIVVGGQALRTTDANTTPQTVSAYVEVTQADYKPIGADFLYLASITINEVP